VLSRLAGTATETVLIVEDEDAVRKLVAATLAQDGYQLLTASSADEAVERARAAGHAIDLLLTDATMPGRSGIELAKELLAKQPGLAVIVMSGYLHTGDDLQAVGGAEIMLHKPFTPHELRARVRQVLDRRVP
jgi:DNA-binding response OmpR family regulator